MSNKQRAKLIELRGGSDPFWASCRLRRSSKARRLSARVLADGEIELVLPMRQPEKEGLAFLQKQGAWLEKQLASSVAPVSFLDHLKNKPFITIDGKKRDAVIQFGRLRRSSESWRRSETGSVVLTLDPVRDLEKQSLRSIKKIARLLLPVRVAHLGESHGLRPNQVRVGDQRRRWGSCSSTGVMALNWRILLLDPSLQDYVIQHELTHLEIMNHSKNYWKRLTVINARAIELDRLLAQISSRLLQVGRQLQR